MCFIVNDYGWGNINFPSANSVEWPEVKWNMPSMAKVEKGTGGWGEGDYHDGSLLSGKMQGLWLKPAGHIHAQSAPGFPEFLVTWRYTEAVTLADWYDIFIALGQKMGFERILGVKVTPRAGSRSRKLSKPRKFPTGHKWAMEKMKLDNWTDAAKERRWNWQ